MGKYSNNLSRRLRGKPDMEPVRIGLNWKGDRWFVSDVTNMDVGDLNCTGAKTFYISREGLLGGELFRKYKGRPGRLVLLNSEWQGKNAVYDHDEQLCLLNNAEQAGWTVEIAHDREMAKYHAKYNVLSRNVWSYSKPMDHFNISDEDVIDDEDLFLCD
jgi:hypothetical protein